MCNLISAAKTVGFIFWRQLLTRTRWDLVDNPKQNPCRNVGVFYALDFIYGRGFFLLKNGHFGHYKKGKTNKKEHYKKETIRNRLYKKKVDISRH